MERGKNDRTRKEKEERMRGKPSRQEKERERAEKAREKEMQRMEKNQVKLDREKDRLEKERQRTLQRQAELEEMKGRLTVLEPGVKDGHAPTATSSSKTPQAQVQAQAQAHRAQAQVQAHASAPKSSTTLASAQEMLLRRKLEVSLHPSVPGAQPDWCPEDKASDVSFGDDSTSVTDDLTSSNIASLERANERLRKEVEKREGEYRALQEEVRTLSSKVTRLRQQNATDLGDITQEGEGGGGASGGVEVGVEELERTVQELEQRIVQMENAGDLLAESMETAAIGKWQSLEGEEVVGQQLSDMVDQMKAMLQQASAAAQRLPPLLPPPLTPANFPLHHHHPSGSEQKSSGGPRNFERVYSHAMKLQVQMNNLRLSQLERNKEILLIKQQLLLQEVNNVLMQASIRRREKDLHQYALSRQQQAAAHLKRWNTFSVQGANGSLPPLLRKLNVRDTEGVTTTKPTTTSSLKAKRTTTNLPASTTATTTTATTTAATTTTTTTAGFSSSPVTSKPSLQSTKQSGKDTPVTSATQGVEGGGVGTTPVTSTNQEVEGSGGVQTPVSSTKQGVEGSGVETPATSKNQGVEGSGQKTPVTSTYQGVQGSGVVTPVTLANQEVKRGGGETPDPSANQGVEGSGQKTPDPSANQGVEGSTPVTSTNQGVEGSGMQTPVTSTNQGVEGSGQKTPDTSTYQEVEGSTPVTSANQGVEGSGMQTPVTSTNQGVEGSGVSTPVPSTNQGVEVETPVVPMAPHAESEDTHTQAVPAAQREPGTESREAGSTLDTGDISTADEESQSKSLHPTPTPGQLATSTTTTTTTTSSTAPVLEENISITAVPSEKNTPGTSEVTASANSSEPGESTSAAESSLEEKVSGSAVRTEEKKDVTEQDSTTTTISAPAVESEDVIVTDAEKLEDVKEPDAERVSLPSADNADDSETNVVCVSDARADHLEDTESSLAERLSFPSGTVDPCVSSPSFPGIDAETNVTSYTTALATSAARTPVSSAVTTVTPAETPSVASAMTTVGTGSDTAAVNISGPNTTHEDNVPKTSTSWQQNVSEQQQQQQRTEKERRLHATKSATNNAHSESSTTQPETSPEKGLGGSGKQITLRDTDDRTTRKTLSSSSSSLHHGSRARRLKPAAELLQESQRYRSGHSVYATRIMNRYLPSRSSQPGSPSPWDRNTTADSRRVCRDGVPLRSPGSSGASSSLSLHRADSPARTHSELMSHVAHRLSSSSGYIARARLGKSYSCCSTVCAEFPTGDTPDGAAAAPGVVNEEDKTTLLGQALSSASHFSASAASKGSTPEGDGPHSRSEPSEEKHPVPEASLPVVDLEGTEQRDTGRGIIPQDSTPGRASIGQDRSPESNQNQSLENTPADCYDPVKRPHRGGKEKTPSCFPSEQRSTGSPIPDVTSESSSDPVTSTVTPSTSSPSDVTTGPIAGKKKSRSRILNISWFQKPKKFFTTSK